MEQISQVRIQVCILYVLYFKQASHWLMWHLQDVKSPQHTELTGCADKTLLTHRTHKMYRPFQHTELTRCTDPFNTQNSQDVQTLSTHRTHKMYRPFQHTELTRCTDPFNTQNSQDVQTLSTDRTHKMYRPFQQTELTRCTDETL